MRAPIYNETAEFALQRRGWKHPSAASRAFEESKLPKHAIPHGAFIFVGDGRKALFLRNEGDEKFAKFVTERVLVDERNPRTHDQGTDEPGRGFAACQHEQAQRSPHRISLHIAADLWAQPLPEKFFAKTEIDLETGEYAFRS